MHGLFAAAEEVVSRFFRDRVDDPGHGTIEIHGERYVLVRAAALSVEFFDLVRSLYGEDRRAEADEFARTILFDLAHAMGRTDARNFHKQMNLTDPIARLSTGPVHFAHASWAFVEILPESRPAPDDSYCLVYDHPYSFESDAWVRNTRHSEVPVCIMNAGYSSGWCEESFGPTLVAAEILCRAKSDETCRFITAPPERIAARIAAYVAENPHVGPRAAHFRIPDFFVRKREEEDLKKRQDNSNASYGRRRNSRHYGASPAASPTTSTTSSAWCWARQHSRSASSTATTRYSRISSRLCAPAKGQRH